jgi:hypothetical protein
LAGRWIETSIITLISWSTGTSTPFVWIMESNYSQINFRLDISYFSLTIKSFENEDWWMFSNVLIALIALIDVKWFEVIWTDFKWNDENYENYEFEFKSWITLTNLSNFPRYWLHSPLLWTVHFQSFRSVWG